MTNRRTILRSAADFTLTPDSGLGNTLTSRTAAGQGWPDAGSRVTPSVNGSVYDESTHRMNVSGKDLLLARGNYTLRLSVDAYVETTDSALGIIVESVSDEAKVFVDRRITGSVGESISLSMVYSLQISEQDQGLRIYIAKRTAGGAVRLQDATMYLRYDGNEEELA